MLGVWGMASLALLAADTPLENKGAPMRIPFACTQEDVGEAGLTCSQDQPCPVYLELNGVEAALNRIFVAGDLHTSEATLFSVLLASEDGGKTWTEPYPRTRFISLDQIQFIDFETGWVSGANVQGVPRDPFFLVTSDGGKTWNNQPVFEESRTGVIERFWFDSQTNGSLWIDTKLRHEFYETSTGAGGWALRQVSDKPIPAKRSRSAADAAIRIRAEARTKSYLIEKHQGERWVEIAAFLVNAGTCTN